MGANDKLDAALHDPERLALVRAAIDGALNCEEGLYGWLSTDPFGHVEQIDGMVNTEHIAQDVLTALRGHLKP